jgi:hypothetical protein
MELLKQLHALKNEDKFSKEEISQITSVEALFFVVTEAKQNKPNYTNLYSLFEQIRDIMIEQQGFNVFEEFLTIKYFFLESAYNLDTITLDALLRLLGPVELDYELEERYFSNDKFYKYYLERYNQFKHNNELTIFKLLDSLNISDLSVEGEKLEEAVGQLKALAGLSN